MFESLERLDRSATVAAAVDRSRAEVSAGCELLELAAHWADLHAVDALPRHLAAGPMLGERGVQFGGSGTPPVAEFAAAELAPEIALSLPQAQALIADALDLRHRLPRLWRRVQSAQLPAWRARRVARRTRELPAAVAADVDREVAGTLGALSIRQIDNRVSAAVLRSDPERAARLAEAAARSRHVTVGQSTEHGVTNIHVCTDAPDAVFYDATVNQIADILMTAAADGRRIPGVPERDARTRDEWRAVAHAVISRPLLAARILLLSEQPDLFESGESADPSATPAEDHAASEFRPDLRRDCAVPTRPGASRPAQPEPGPCGAVGAIGWIPGWGGLVDNSDMSRSVPVLTDADGGRLDPRWWRPVSDASDCSNRPTDPATGSNRFRDALPGSEAVESWLCRLDPLRVAPRVTLHVHVAAGTLTDDDGVARVEGIGPTLLSRVRRWLGRDTRIRLLPVLDPDAVHSVDAYEVPARMADALRERHPTSVFPYSGVHSRAADLDHTAPYRPPPAGSPGQTALDNLGPFSRAEHRYKTHGRLKVRQPTRGTYVFRTPYRRVLITNDTGTHDLGTGDFADAIWAAADAKVLATAG